jgi:hypothetical protein
MNWSRSGGSARQRAHDRGPSHRTGRPPGRHRRGHHRQRHADRDQPPRHVEPIDAKSQSGLQPRLGRDPPEKTEGGPGHGGNHTDHGAVGDHHEAHVFLGRPDRRHHAHLSQPAVGDHHEACGRQEGDEEQRHRGDAERQDHGDDTFIEALS